MNIPSNFNHYVAGDMPELISKYKGIYQSMFEEILKTYEWDKHPEQMVLKNCLQCATYPDEYLKDEKSKTFRLSSNEQGIKIMVPGPNVEWDSIFHIFYIGFFAIQETKLYHLYYYKIEQDKVLGIILNGYDKKKIMETALRIRFRISHGRDRMELHDICHCEDPEDPEGKDKYHRKDEYKGEWTEEKLIDARNKIIEIIKKNPEIRPLLDEKEDMDRRYEIDLLYQMNDTLEKLHYFNEKKLHKIECDIHKAGGHAAYVRENEVGFSINMFINETKAGLFDELVNHKIDNGWGVTWKQRRDFGIDKLEKKYDSIILEKVSKQMEEETRELRIITTKIE